MSAYIFASPSKSLRARDPVFDSHMRATCGGYDDDVDGTGSE